MSFEQLQSQADSNTERLDALKKIPDLPVNTNPPETGFTVLYNPITGQDERVPYASFPSGPPGQDGSGSQNRVITLADPTDLAELNAITGMAEGDITVVTNYLNDKVTFIYDGTNWILAQAQEFRAVVRYNEDSGKFEFIDDTGHTPMGALSIQTDPLNGFQFSITKPDSDKIGAVIAGVDEQFAERGYFIGASVSNNTSYFRVTKQGFNVRAQYSSGAGDLVIANDSSSLIKDQDISVTHDPATGITTFSHPDIVTRINRRAIAHPNYHNTILRPQVVTESSTGCTVKWYNYSDNTQVTAFSSSMRMVLEQKGGYIVPTDRVSATGNFWIKGTFYTV